MVKYKASAQIVFGNLIYFFASLHVHYLWGCVQQNIIFVPFNNQFAESTQYFFV